MNRPDNRPDIVIVESIAKNPNISWLDVKSGATTNQIDSLFPALISGISGFVAGAFVGPLVFKQPAESLALAGGLACACYNVFYFLDRWLSAPHYGASFYDALEEADEIPEQMIGTGRNGQINRLSRDMAKLLYKFGRYYPELNGFGINKWEGRPARIIRDDLSELKVFLRNIGAARQNGQLWELTEWGELQLGKWANKDFGAVFELADTSPTLGGD